MHKLTDLPECPHLLGPANPQGYWFCGLENEPQGVKAFFSTEWDSVVHLCCLRRAAEEGLDPEVITMLDELDIEHA